MMQFDPQNMQWENNILSLFPYRSARSGQADILSRRLWDFKENKPFAIHMFQQWAVQALNYAEVDFLDTAAQWYILSMPRSKANIPNKSCEDLCTHIAQSFSWIYHIPNALLRIQDVDSSAKAYKEGRRRISQQEHANTIIYNGPVLNPFFGIIAVDDVVTTSSTFQACCGILRKEIGCEHIFGLCIGRTKAL